MHRKSLWAWVVLSTFACSGSEERSGAVGALGGPCTSGGACDEGLTCAAGVCESASGGDRSGGSTEGCPEGEIPKDCDHWRSLCDCGPKPSCDHCSGETGAGADAYVRCLDRCEGVWQSCGQQCNSAYESCSKDPPCVACNKDEDCAESRLCREVVVMTGAGAEPSIPDCVEATGSGAGGTSSAGGAGGVGGGGEGGSGNAGSGEGGSGNAGSGEGGSGIGGSGAGANSGASGGI